MKTVTNARLSSDRMSDKMQTWFKSQVEEPFSINLSKLDGYRCKEIARTQWTRKSVPCCFGLFRKDMAVQEPASPHYLHYVGKDGRYFKSDSENSVFPFVWWLEIEADKAFALPVIDGSDFALHQMKRQIASPPEPIVSGDDIIPADWVSREYSYQPDAWKPAIALFQSEVREHLMTVLLSLGDSLTER